MLALAHIGITLGAGVIMRTAYSLTDVKEDQPETGHSQHYPQKRLNPLAVPLDIRLLFIGSLLPDIIDKPLGMIILRDSLANGRIFAHTLLFLVVLTICGTYLWTSRRQLWLSL